MGKLEGIRMERVRSHPPLPNLLIHSHLKPHENTGRKLFCIFFAYYLVIKLQSIIFAMLAGSKLKTNKMKVTFKVEQNANFGDFRVVKYLNGTWLNERDGNGQKTKQNKKQKFTDCWLPKG
jgi:hypothetical protein